MLHTMLEFETKFDWQSLYFMTMRVNMLLSEYKDMQFGNGVLNPYTYINNHLENIDYAAYRKAGYVNRLRPNRKRK
ncbi:MAG: hypothetical protein Ta2G_01590 [Termitinemataceae bacterium]|nr:MAG: hypothetical protein Ta2G_01590 [Termitinemataceae bacterium]